MPNSEFIHTPTTPEAITKAQDTIDAYLQSHPDPSLRDTSLLPSEIIDNKNCELIDTPKEYALTIAARLFGAITFTNTVDNPHYLNQLSENAILEETLKYDDITGYLSRHGLYKWAKETYDQNDPDFNTYGIFAVDLKNFKSINDKLGHFKGNDALKVACDFIMSLLRIRDEESSEIQEMRHHKTKDLVARFGGDELIFVVDLNGNDLDTAQKVVDRISNKLDTQRIKITCDNELIEQEFGFRSGAVIVGKHNRLPFEVALRQADTLERAKKGEEVTNEKPVRIDYMHTIRCANCEHLIITPVVE